ncbi:FGGY family carbohydrate kinase [Paenibacillus sp. FSL H7-0357]|uniref:sedoheptulokinase n=1 Tax=Paenibacillus sp. FSL H7-0357 TaxID=1536774 RepID=UPI000690976B|nr:FGGY family carbohydrate kinase [Paenibacillus sp. FSL H7-0357]
MKYIGLDIGTTSISGLVYDLEQRTVLHTISDEGGNTPTGSAEWERLQDPERILLQVEDILEQLVSWEPDVSGIGLTGQMHGILYINRNGQHVSPLYTWQDGRGGLPYDASLSYAQKLSESTGYPVTPGYGLATHYYNLLHDLVPNDASSFCTIADYVALRLAGCDVPRIDATQAAAIGCYSFLLNDFDRTALAEAGIVSKMLPQVVPSGTVVGLTSHGIPVYTSLGDNQASFLGSVPAPDQSLLLNIGTGSQLSVLLPEGMEQVDGMEMRPYPGGGVLMVGAALSGGKSYALLEHFFRQIIEAYTGEAAEEVYSIMDRLLKDNPAGSQGLTVHSQFLGTRSNPSTRGSIEGISLDNFTPGKLAHAFLEGMVDELHVFYTALGMKTGRTYDYIVGSGNALRANTVLCAKVRSAFRLPFSLSSSQEEAAVGSALCAAVGSGYLSSFREAGEYITLEQSNQTCEVEISSKDKLRLMDKYGLSAPEPQESVIPFISDAEEAERAELPYTQSAGLMESGPRIIPVLPGQSIGPLRLGMTEAEIAKAAAEFPLFYKVEYNGAGSAVFIEIANSGEEWTCSFAGIDLFATMAEKLIIILDQLSPYERNPAETGCTYTFPQLGLTLWRSDALSEADLLTEEYLSLPPDIYEDEKRLLYFESVSVFVLLKEVNDETDAL